MAYYDDETDQRQGLSDLSGTAGPVAATPAGGAPAAGAPSAPAGAPGATGGATTAGTGYINLQRYLGANEGAGAGMAGQIASNVTQQAQQGLGSLGALKSEAVRNSAADLQSVNPGLYEKTGDQLSEAAANARAASDPAGGGLGALMTTQYGGQGGYGSGMRGFDSFLARGAGGDTLGAVGKYGGLDSYLGAASEAYQPSAPGAPKMGEGASTMSPKGISMGGGGFAPAPVASSGAGGGAGPGDTNDPRRKRRMV